MAIESQEVKIGSTTYTINQHGPDEGDEIVAYLAKIAGPVAAAMRGALDTEVVSPDFGRMLSGALANLNGKEHAKFMRLLLSTSAADGLPLGGPGYDAHFIGRLGERYQLAAQVINFNGFFELVAALGGFLQPSGQTTSTAAQT
jgi:hypothetical protein